MKKLSLLALMLTFSLTLAAPYFTVGGAVLNLPSVQQDGTLYVDAAALAKALGFTLTFDQAKNSYVLQAQAPAGPSGNGQLAGGNAAVGQAYTVGQGDEALNFTLKSAEFVATRVNIGTQSYSPTADQKLLVLHYGVQNPGKSEQRYYESTLRFTVIDDQNTNHQNVEAVGREGSSEAVDLPLKPAQKIDVYTVLTLPAGNSAPKLIVQSGSDPVLRYDLRGAVQALPAPYADPQNPLNVQASLPAQAGSYFQVGALDLRLDAAAFSDSPIGGSKPADGHRFLIATFSVRNGTPSSQRLSYNNLLPTLRLASGDKVDWNQNVLKAGSDDSLDVTLKPGEEIKTWLYFEVPTGDAPKALSLAQDNSRPIMFDVSGAK